MADAERGSGAPTAARPVNERPPVPGWRPADWQAPPGVRAGVTTREGGVGSGAHATFNLAAYVGDAAAAVAANRARLAAALALPAAPRWLRQMHGVGVAVQRRLEAPGAFGSAATGQLPDSGEPPEADAAVTFEPGVVLAVLSADCLPVVLAHRTGDRVGIAHAGWRGLAAGVIERTVAALAAPAAELSAWLGPAIGSAAFEVGAEVRAAFVAGDPGAAAGFVANARGRWQADLYLLARRRLERLGVDRVEGGGACTYTNTAQFFSYRRDPACGRMATLVWIEPVEFARPGPT